MEANQKPEKKLKLQELRINQDFSQELVAERLLTTVPVRKPGKQDFNRVHSGEDYRAQFALLDLEEDKETYLVSPSVFPHVRDDAYPAMLFTAINRSGVVFIWPVKLPREDGKALDWHRSAMEAATNAIKKWTKMSAKMALGAYEISEARADFPEPEWPEKSFEEILDIAFKGRIIDSVDHPVIKRLKGEA